MTRTTAAAILLATFIHGIDRASAEEFPVPTDAQWEAIQYPTGYGCGLFAENQARKGNGWFISGSAPSAEAECRKACEVQIAKARSDYRDKGMRVSGTCFLGKKPLFRVALAGG